MHMQGIQVMMQRVMHMQAVMLMQRVNKVVVMSAVPVGNQQVRVAACQRQGFLLAGKKDYHKPCCEG